MHVSEDHCACGHPVTASLASLYLKHLCSSLKARLSWFYAVSFKRIYCYVAFMVIVIINTHKQLACALLILFTSVLRQLDAESVCLARCASKMYAKQLQMTEGPEQFASLQSISADEATVLTRTHPAKIIR